MSTRFRTRDGFALPAALLAIVVVGALVTGGLYASMEEDRSSGNVEYGNHALMAAERGLQDLLGTKTRLYFQDTVGIVGTADTLGPVSVDVNGVSARYTLYVQRLHSRLFKVESEGEVLSGGRYAGSKRRVAEMFRIQWSYYPKDRAYTTQAPVRLRGQSMIDGTDMIPTGWTGCSTVGVQAAVVTNDATTIDVPPSGPNTGLYGSPEYREDATMDSTSFAQHGDLDVEELKTLANHVISPGTYSGMAPSTTGGVCNVSDPMNWGDPDNTLGACHYYWPILYVPGDLHITTGRGQGILIVDGNFSISGNVEFKGIVFVYGNITATGTGNKVAGSINLLGNGTSELGVTGAGNTQVQLSSCAIERALTFNSRYARPIPLGIRKYVDISGLGVN